MLFCISFHLPNTKLQLEGSGHWCRDQKKGKKVEKQHKFNNIWGKKRPKKIYKGKDPGRHYHFSWLKRRGMLLASSRSGSCVFLFPRLPTYPPSSPNVCLICMRCVRRLFSSTCFCQKIFRNLHKQGQSNKNEMMIRKQCILFN